MIIILVNDTDYVCEVLCEVIQFISYIQIWR